MTDDRQYDEHEYDQEIRVRLTAMETPPTALAAEALRQRVLVAAAPALAARAARAHLTLSSTPSAARSSWLDVTGRFGRIAIPLSIAAAALAMVLLRQLPEPAVADDTSASLSYRMIGEYVMSDTTSAPEITDGLLLPESADDVLLATPPDGQPQ